MKVNFDEMSMVLLIQQNESLQQELTKLGYDSSKESLEQMKFLINNNFLNHKCKKALNKIFKEHVENKSGYLTAMYDGLEGKHRTIEPVDGHRFYVYHIEERNGEYEYDHKGVVQLGADDSPEEWLEDYTSDFYGGGDGTPDENHDGGYWFNGEILCWAGGITEISKDEFDVVSRYI
jgi:hypothetical protein